MRGSLSIGLKLVLWAFAVLPLMGWWATGLFDLDEGFYAAVVSEMLRRGDWITPYYNGAPWFEKPILLYWLGSGAVALFGEQVGPRLSSVIFTLATYWLVLTTVRRYVSEAAGYWAMTLLSGSLLFVAAGRMMLTDPPYVFLLSLALLGFFRSLQEGTMWRLIAGAALGLATLAKGPVAIFLFVVIVVSYFLINPGQRSNYRRGWFLFLALLLAALCAWYVPVYLRHPDGFVQEFIIRQNIGRLSGGDAAHSMTGPLNWVFYVVILFLGCFPWICKLPWCVGRSTSESRDLLNFCWLWLGVVFILFTISKAKLPHYILPTIPPLAIIVGIQVEDWKGRKLSAAGFFEGFGPSLAGRAFLALLLNGGIAVYYYGFETDAFGPKWVLPGAHAEVHRLASGLRDDKGTVASFQMPRRQKEVDAGTPNLQETSHPSLVFYLGRSVRLVEDPADLVAGEPVQWVLTRKGRVTPEIEARLRRKGFVLEETPQSAASKYYKCYRLKKVDVPKPEPHSSPEPQPGVPESNNIPLEF